VAEPAFALARLFGQDMAKVLLLVLDLAGPGKRKAFGCAFLSLHLRHDAILSLFLDLRAQYHGHETTFHRGRLIHDVLAIDPFKDILKDIQSEFGVG